MHKNRVLVNVGIFSMGLFCLLGLTFFCIGCGHYHNWWSLLSPGIIVMAIFIPGVCYGYDTDEPEWMLRDHTNWSEGSFRMCRDLGWIVVMLLVVASYGVPAVVWYNAELLWPGVLWVMAGVMLWWWAYILMLRIFVFT